jgi:hypothetical protein
LNRLVARTTEDGIVVRDPLPFLTVCGGPNGRVGIAKAIISSVNKSDGNQLLAAGRQRMQLRSLEYRIIHNPPFITT